MPHNTPSTIIYDPQIPTQNLQIITFQLSPISSFLLCPKSILKKTCKTLYIRKAPTIFHQFQNRFAKPNTSPKLLQIPEKMPRVQYMQSENVPALIRIILTDDDDALRAALGKSRHCINLPYYGKSAIYYAIQFRAEKCLNILLENGADSYRIGCPKRRTTTSAYHTAISNRSIPTRKTTTILNLQKR